VPAASRPQARNLQNGLRATLVHALPGRARFRLLPGSLSDGAPLAHALCAISGVKSAVVTPRTGSILIHYDAEALSQSDLVRALFHISAPEAEDTQTRAAQEPQADGIWPYIGYQLFRLLLPAPLKPAWTLISAIPYLRAGLASLFRARLDVPALDAAAVAASLSRGDTQTASTLLMLLKTGEYLEQWARQRSRENLAASLSLNVGQVWVAGADGAERQIPFEQLRVGDTIVLRSGALIPVDGTTLDGRAMVNEAALTGEPLGVEKRAPLAVHAGTVVEDGELRVLVRKKGTDTRYQEIIRLIEDSEQTRADTEVKAARLAGRAVPFTFAAAALTLLLSRDGRKAASVLQVDYSCAIKLATPLAFLAAIREGLGCGVFFKGGAPLEKLALADTVVFDKTGTLTCAAPSLTRIIPYNGADETEALKIAACLEEHFPHPVARAVVGAALARDVKHREEHSQVKYIAAHGIATEYQGKHTVIGSRHFIGEDEGVDLSLARADEEAAAKEGCSVLYLAREGRLIALLLFRDPPRSEAAEVVAMLRQLGVQRIYLLSGDNEATARRIARELKLDGGRGGLLPQDKSALITELRRRGCTVAFVGDGMNDAPALFAANVGIAMKDGADLARESAGITLKEASLYPLAAARLLAVRALCRIHANTRAAIWLNSAFILMGIRENAAAAPRVSRSVWLHNLTTLGLSLRALSPLLGRGAK
jgi:Cu2+-exporting ATPase